MNLKFAHLVTVQFGILIGIAACLVFLHFENARPRTTSERREPPTKKSPAEDESATVDSHDELERDERLAEQSAYPLPSEYSPEAVEKSRAILAKLYYEQIGPRRNATAVAQTYTEVAQEPAAVQTYEPPPQPVTYAEPTVVLYPPPGQFISFARPRPFVNRCRPASNSNVLASNSDRRRDNRGIHLPKPGPPRSLGLEQRSTTGGPTCPSPQGFTSRGKALTGRSTGATVANSR